MRKIPANQAGFVMVMAMMFMLALTVLAITAVRRVTLDEKFVNSMKTQNLAFQSAETALRYCEREFEFISKGNPVLPGIAKTAGANGAPEFPIIRQVGLGSSTDPDPPPSQWRTRANWATMAAKLPAGTVTNVSDQPECMIEEWQLPSKSFGRGGKIANRGSGGSPAVAYVFTARAQGTSATSVVWLQAVLYLGNGALK